MEFIKFFPVDKKLYIEFTIDKYIETQPLTTKQVDERVKEWSKQVCMLNSYTERNGFTEQIVIVDMDKAINCQKLNYTLLAKAMHGLLDSIGDKFHRKVYVTHANATVLSLYSGLKPLLPEVITKVISFR